VSGLVDAAGRRRVVVTGMGGMCALGGDWPTLRDALRAGHTGVRVVPAFAEIEGLRTRLGAPVGSELDLSHHPRKKLRGMGRVARLAAVASERALAAAGLAGSPLVSDGTLGMAFGSTDGSPPPLVDYARAFGVERSAKGVSPVGYLQFMSHTCAANLAQLFEVRGMVLPTCSACTSGSQAIGAGLDAIRAGRHPLMLVGGAEELHEISVAVFDLLLATSVRNDAPESTPRPFDRERDGLVVGEGAGALVLEALEHARRRGATIFAEVLGYGTNCDGAHLTVPEASGMRRAMELALEDARLPASAVGYVNAHATATEVGDLAESEATHAVFGARVPVSSQKGHLGHTLGACGALEAWITIEALREGWLPPTRNLETPDPRCAPLDHVLGDGRSAQVETAVSNNFAFGGINTSLVLRPWREG
jgi:3-oxoacyl-[acyl-carrier-protein] synthase II